MTVTMTTTTTTLQYLYHQFENLDSNTSEKILDLIEKQEQEQTMIGFAGHFSAGKSTLINTLLERDLLPSSPIPTSANIVHLTEGDPYTITYFREDAPVKYSGEIPFHTVKALCKDGEQITRVDISRQGTGLPEHVTLLDTPGVDSTNDADRLITESSLHVMDYMYYVMDYNHVQSEVNLQFLLEMQKRGTPFSIVINQIDKHDEEELPFKSFQTSVKESLHQWGIQVDHIYYVSLRDFSLKQNEYSTLERDFKSLFHGSLEKSEEQILRSLKQVVSEYQASEDQKKDKERHQLEERYEELALHVPEGAVDGYPDIEQLQKEAEESFHDQVRSFIPNAYLMPSQLREEAERFLESVQPGFKVGFLFSKQKTEDEQAEREKVFHEHLMKTVEKNLVWPLRERMVRLIEAYDIGDPSLLQLVQSESFEYAPSRLHDLVESGASVTGAYVLRYTDEVSKDVKREMKTHIHSWWKAFNDALEEQHEKRREESREVYEAVEELHHIQNQLQRIEENKADEWAKIDHWFEKPEPLEDMKDHVEHQLLKRRNRMTTGTITAPSENRKEDVQAETNQVTSEKKPSSKNEVMETVHQLIEAVDSIEGLETLVEQLRSKQSRLRNRRYTVALFGAFSAGKSSFANALLGDRLLPASPNPTTATINKISPPDSMHPHQTIRVSVKKENELIDDLSDPLQKIGVEGHQLSDIRSRLEELTDDAWMKLSHKNRAFIHAFLEGYDHMSEQLGKIITIPWEQFSQYVADESFSCFIESMELYYDCRWTRAGVTLVDTPGADSVNARHTDVSFEYIKDADAILFVTYYNHPFSKADQSFLTQLGRVKDSFAMDKMFFILNAADLAESDEELQHVERYVKEQLQGFHIRQPRLFSLSSKEALQEKRSELPSSLDSFEDCFEQFLEEELQQVLIESIKEDMDSVSQTIQSFIDYARLDEQERANRLESLKEEKERANKRFEPKDLTSDLKQIENKATKQLHYVHERMMLNANDLFKQHVNPATINGKDAPPREQVQSSIKHFIEDINFEMKQELRAVSLRIERMLENMMVNEKDRIEKELRTIENALRLQMPEWEPLDVPRFESVWSLSDKEVNSLSKEFKNTRSFFEKNEKEELKEDLLKRISPELKAALHKEQQTIQTYYQNHWESQYETHRVEWQHQIDAIFERLRYSLNHTVDVQELTQKQEHVDSIISRSN
ncbi:dynamin family protein [Halobacillus locisalis]|uniref:Dynamin family protein n=1 Tax=Halobacillus locisalis TaxID=220753 RepID=A0A838CQ10_9BACI|nr:dynamin family protein [Halobacillus locisalis]MBA2173958.1 dynamin family protein [Halobacillus locisalis]